PSRDPRSGGRRRERPDRRRALDLRGRDPLDGQRESGFARRDARDERQGLHHPDSGATIMNLPNRPSGTMTGGRALAEMLRLAEVGPMFGMGGFQLLPFYDAVAQLGLQHFLVNDERCGAFAADAWARVTNRPGVCDGTLGPGATNLVTALVESLNAGVPVVAIAGDTHRAHSW